MSELLTLLIKEIQIIPIPPRGGLVAFASAVINNLYVGNISIYTCPSAPDGFRLVYPTRILENGTKIDLLHPIDRETGTRIQKAIVEQYLKIINELAKGGRSYEQEQ